MDQCYTETQEKLQYYSTRGFIVTQMWECQFRYMMRTNELLKTFVQEYSQKTRKRLPLDPRNAFFGGRTNAAKLYHAVEEGEKIRYKDFTSLYPWCVKYGAFPCGHPEIIKENFKPINAYDGFVYCRVSPPPKLLFPVLPLRIREKLVFCLCYACAVAENQGPCAHSWDERHLTGTWTTPELGKAIEKGYQLIEVFEVWHFPQMAVYDPSTGRKGLFEDFMNKWLRIKQEASGYPADCVTINQKEEYIRLYLEREGITLDKGRITPNPGLRSLAKLMVNSFWGKFAQRSNLTKTNYIRDPSDYFKLHDDPTIEVLDAFFISEDIVMVQHNNIEGFIKDSSHSNLAIAAFTTTYARLKLYDLIDSLGDQVLYYDTDSVVYTTKPGQLDPKTGSFLGELTDEVADYGPNAYITQFVSAGPKNYSYIVLDPDTNNTFYTCKVKGITLNFSASKHVNFERMKELVRDRVESNGEQDGGGTSVVYVPQLLFRSNYFGEVSTATIHKKYQVVYDKRRVLPDYTTLPFGYID
jgi:DNA polymerase type B, organellar and viral